MLISIILSIFMSFKKLQNNQSLISLSDFLTGIKIYMYIIYGFLETINSCSVKTYTKKSRYS